MKKPTSIIFILFITLLGGNNYLQSTAEEQQVKETPDFVTIPMEDLQPSGDAVVVDMGTDDLTLADQAERVNNPLFVSGGDEEEGGGNFYALPAADGTGTLSITLQDDDEEPEQFLLTRWQKVKRRFGKFWATPGGKIVTGATATIVGYLIVNWLSTYINNSTATPGQNDNLVKDFIKQVTPVIEASVKKEIEALKDLQSLSFSDAIRTVTNNVTGTIAPVLQQVQNNAVAIVQNGADIASNGVDITQAVNQIAATRIELATHAAQVSAFIASHP